MEKKNCFGKAKENSDLRL